MRSDPIGDKSGLLSALGEAWGLNVRRVCLVPCGEFAWSYALHSNEQRRWLLKVFDLRRRGDYPVERLDACLALMVELREKSILEHLPRPVSTLAGTLRTAFAGHVLVLFEYVQGRSLHASAPLPDVLVPSLGRSIGRLHAATSEVETPIPVAERLELDFEPALLGALERLERRGARTRSGARTLWELLAPHREQVDALLARARALRDALNGWAPEHVLCHADLHGGNLIEGADGSLFLLDWEEACLGPPELELFGFTQGERHIHRDQLPVLLDHYESMRGPVELDPRAITFFSARRYLADLTDWLVRVLDGSGDERQDAADLQAIRRECLERWGSLDDDVEWLERSSKERRRRRGAPRS